MYQSLNLSCDFVKAEYADSYSTTIIVNTDVSHVILYSNTSHVDMDQNVTVVIKTV